MNHQSDSYILTLLKDGDTKAFDHLYLKYYKLLYANAYFILRDEQAAKDIVQVFFVEVWEKQLFLSLEGDVKGYFYRSIQNRCLNEQRKQQSEQRRYEVFMRHQADDVVEEQWFEPSPVNLQEALLTMPGQRREALQLVYLQDKKYSDAANTMGISINTLKTHLKIGLKVLREKLKQ